MEQVITAVVSEKGSQKRKVFVNDSFLFAAYPAELSQRGLKEGVQLADTVYQEFCHDVLLPRAKKRVLNLLTTKDRTKKELCDKLSSDGYPQEVAEEAIEYADSYHYVDDLRLAASYIRAGQEEKSRRQLTVKLTEKGVSREVIEEAFEIVCEERLEVMGDEYEEAEITALRRLIAKKSKNQTVFSEKERQKLMTSLYAKGFRQADIARVFDSIKE